MTNEKGFTAYALLGHVADDMVVDTLLPEDRGAGVAPVKKERPRRFMSFLESGWGVAIICALVAVSVMGGIIWAGNQTGTGVPPGGTVEPESEGNTIETNTPLLEQNNVVVYGADGACYPKRILCNSTDLTQGEDGLEHGVTADGLGFVGHMKQYGGADLPTVVWAKDVETTDYVDVAPNYTITQISMYDMNMVEQMTKTAMTLDDEMFAARFIERWLSVGKWYVSFRVTHREGNSHHCECDYAFIADVRQTLDTIVTRSCTLRTDGDRYKWGGNSIYMAILTSTVPGAILDIGEESWQLLNLDTDEYVKVTWAVVDSDDTSQGDRTLLSPSSPTDLGWYYRLLQFDWKTTPPGRYRLTYTGTELSEGEEYPYYDFEIYYDVASIDVTDQCTIRTDKDRYEWGQEKLATYTVDLTCTVAGVILDISKYDFELVNLATGKPATMIYIKITDYVDKNLAFPKAPDAFAQYRMTLLFDWKTTPPGRYRLTYTGTEPAEGEEYPHYDFEIYTPEPRMAVWGSDTYVIPAEALRWAEAWDAASQTMIGSESRGWADIEYHIKYHQLEMPVMRVAPETDIRVAGADITRCVIYNSDCDIVYQGDSWEAAMECVLKTPADTSCFVVFTAYWQGDYVPEANAYEGRVYEYAFRLVVQD